MGVGTVSLCGSVYTLYVALVTLACVMDALLFPSDCGSVEALSVAYVPGSVA